MNLYRTPNNSMRQLRIPPIPLLLSLFFPTFLPPSLFSAFFLCVLCVLCGKIFSSSFSQNRIRDNLIHPRININHITLTSHNPPPIIAQKTVGPLGCTNPAHQRITRQRNHPAIRDLGAWQILPPKTSVI